jgi:predicted porin
MQSRIQQDIEYHDATGVPFIDPLVPYKDRVHSYAVDASFRPSSNLTVTGGVSHTISSGAFYPGSSVLLQPVSVASFSDLKIRETVASAGGEYRFEKGFSVGATYKYSEVKDVLDNPFDDVTNGKAHIVMLSLSKKW